MEYIKYFKSKQQVQLALADQQRKQSNPPPPHSNCIPKSVENRGILRRLEFINSKTPTTTTSPECRGPPLLRRITMKEWIFKDFRYDDKDQVFLNNGTIKDYEQPFAPIKFAPDFPYPAVMFKELAEYNEVPLIEEAKYSSDDLKLSSSSTDDVVKQFLTYHLL